MEPTWAVAISSARSAQQRLANSQPFRLAHSPSTGSNSGARRQVLHHQPRLGGRPGVQVAGVMRAEVVPDDRHRLVAELVAQAVQHADERCCVVGALQQVQAHPGRRWLALARARPVGHQPAHRDLLAASVGVAQHRRLAGGAQVRRTGGVSLTPDSSTKQSQALRGWARLLCAVKPP